MILKAPAMFRMVIECHLHFKVPASFTHNENQPVLWSFHTLKVGIVFSAAMNILDSISQYKDMCWMSYLLQPLLSFTLDKSKDPH